jgi:Tfp pilus assembly protein PilV
MKTMTFGKGAFSLIEVNLAILVAAGGLLALLSFFPLGLRQSVMSQADMQQSTFANSFFESVAVNVRQIDNVEDWNDISKFWGAATSRTGVDTGSGVSGLKTISSANSDSGLSDATKELFYDRSGGGSDRVAHDNLGSDRIVARYVYRESATINQGNGSVLLPPQFIIRILKIDDTPERLRGTSIRFPARYSITLVSSDHVSPAIYFDNPLYHAEFYFYRRP